MWIIVSALLNEMKLFTGSLSRSLKTVEESFRIEKFTVMLKGRTVRTEEQARN